MKNLYYIRHGESEANVAKIWNGHLNEPLSSKGLEQAKIAGQKAKKQGLVFDVIISSPLQRAHNTAKIIAEATGYPTESIVLDDTLKERDFGELENTPHEPTLIDAYWKDETVIDNYKNVEKLAEMNERAKKILNYLKNRSEDTILIVSHGALGRMLRRELEGIPMKAAVNPYPNAEIVKLI